MEMLQSYKGRQVEKGMMVKVYYNLHKHVFSVKDAKTGKVLGHGNNIMLKNPVFQVSEAGRQRVLKENRKNVHAYVIGEFLGVMELDRDVKRQYDILYYSPYKQNKFTIFGTMKDANGQGYHWALLEDKKVYAR